MLMLNLTTEYTNPTCGSTQGYVTNCDSVIAVKTTNILTTAHLDARDVHPDWDWAAALGYVEYIIKKRSYPSYKTSRMSALIYGDCVHQGHCASPNTCTSPPIPTFYLHRLPTSLTNLGSEGSGQNY